MTPLPDALPTGLSRAELASYVTRFGVAEQQVHRDHLISVLLAALAGSSLREQLVFFGGTALSRTYLIDLRLSEDIDLLVVGPRAPAAHRLRRLFDRAVARTHGATSWSPEPEATADTQPAVLDVGEDLRVQVQLLPADHYPRWPTREIGIEQRYSDVAPARLTTLTMEGFVAAKTAAWIDRRAPRDLYDLYALAAKGAVTHAAGELYRRLGPTGQLPGRWAFADPPTEDAWQTALAHQCRVEVGPAEAATLVSDAWRQLRA